MTKYKCADCGRKIRDLEEYYDKEENMYCRECIEDHFIQCEMCEYYAPFEDMEDVGGRDICKYCIEEYFKDEDEINDGSGKAYQEDLEFHMKEEFTLVKSEEVVIIRPKVAKELKEQAILYSENEREKNTIVGLLGGKVINKQIYIEDACLLAYGKGIVEPKAENLKKYAEFYDTIRKRKNFVLGWYCSIPSSSYSFFNRTNYMTQSKYQKLYNKAIAIAIYPEKPKNTPITEFFKVYRLKEDFIMNWVELNFDLVEENVPIKIHSKMLEKILIHSVLLGTEGIRQGDFKLVFGVLGGRIVDKEVYINDAFLLSHGDSIRVEAQPDDIVRMMPFDEKMYEKGGFIIGWYCSIPRLGDFCNSTNYNQQLFYQSGNKLAVGIALHPENFLTSPFYEICKVYRLKEDLSENWIELKYNLIGDDEKSLCDKVKSECERIAAISGLEIAKEHFLEDYLNNSQDLNEN